MLFRLRPRLSFIKEEPRSGQALPEENLARLSDLFRLVMPPSILEFYFHDVFISGVEAQMLLLPGRGGFRYDFAVFSFFFTLYDAGSGDEATSDVMVIVGSARARLICAD